MWWQTRNPVNGWLLATLLLLTAFGFIIFLSASVGLVARDSGADFKSIVTSQTLFGLLPGLFLMFLLSRLSYKTLRRFSFFLIIIAFAVSLLVFVPGLGFEHGGAQRWLDLRITTFQPSELLKIAVIIYLAAWLAAFKNKVTTFKWGMLPFLVLISITGAILLNQPDIDTFLVLIASGTAMYIVAGAPWKHIVWLGLILLVASIAASFVFPYARERVVTFLNPSRDSLGASYQIQQSLIAVGSGEWFGKGFGKSIQKFNYLPEPIGDSVYAVASEEFGFAGSVGLLALFFLLAHQGLRVAARAPDVFGRLLAIGIIVMFLSQAFVNIGAMIGLIPLSGITLPFVSHGGSALLLTLAEAGILLSISRTARERFRGILIHYESR